MEPCRCLWLEDTVTLSSVQQTVVEQGGLQPGGLNFDAKVRRESTDVEDLFVAHVAAMDTFARGLRNAVRIIEDGIMAGMVKVCHKYHLSSFILLVSVNNIIKIPWLRLNKQDRYSSFSRDIGQKVDEGSATLEEMEVCLIY